MTTGDQEHANHDKLIATVIVREGVPITVEAPQVWVALFPMMRALQVPRRMQRWTFAALAEDRQEVRLAFLSHDPRCLIPMVSWRWLGLLCARGRSQEAIRYSLFVSEVLCAIGKHGVYRPENGHEPLPGEELDAIERKEHYREIWASCFGTLVYVDQHGNRVDTGGNRIEEQAEEEAQDPWADHDPRWAEEEDDPGGAQ